MLDEGDGKERSNKKCKAKRTCTWPSVGESARPGHEVCVAGGEQAGAKTACKATGVGGGLVPSLHILWHLGATGSL